MKKIFLQAFIFLLFGVFLINLFSFAPIVYADEIDGQLQAAGGQTGLSKSDPRSTVALIIKSALTLMGTIFIVLMIYAGFLWMTAGGEEEQVNKAKSLIKQAIIGFLIITMAYSITLFAFKLANGKADRQYFESSGFGISFD